LKFGTGPGTLLVRSSDRSIDARGAGCDPRRRISPRGKRGAKNLFNAGKVPAALGGGEKGFLRGGYRRDPHSSRRVARLTASICAVGNFRSRGSRSSPAPPADLGERPVRIAHGTALLTTLPRVDRRDFLSRKPRQRRAASPIEFIVRKPVRPNRRITGALVDAKPFRGFQALGVGALPSGRPGIMCQQFMVPAGNHGEPLRSPPASAPRRFPAAAEDNNAPLTGEYISIHSNVTERSETVFFFFVIDVRFGFWLKTTFLPIAPRRRHFFIVGFVAPVCACCALCIPPHTTCFPVGRGFSLAGRTTDLPLDLNFTKYQAPPQQGAIARSVRPCESGAPGSNAPCWR